MHTEIKAVQYFSCMYTEKAGSIDAIQNPLVPNNIYSSINLRLPGKKNTEKTSLFNFRPNCMFGPPLFGQILNVVRPYYFNFFFQ